MITLYHCVSARSFRPLWLLEELGLPYQLDRVGTPAKKMSQEQELVDDPVDRSLAGV